MVAWLVGSRGLAAAPGRGRRGMDHGIVPEDVEARACRQEAAQARAACPPVHTPRPRARSAATSRVRPKRSAKPPRVQRRFLALWVTAAGEGELSCVSP